MSVYEPKSRERATSIPGAKTKKKSDAAKRAEQITLSVWRQKSSAAPRSPLLTSLAFSIRPARRMIEEYLVRHELFFIFITFSSNSRKTQKIKKLREMPKKLIRSRGKILKNINQTFFHHTGRNRFHMPSFDQIQQASNRTTFFCTRSSFSVWLSSANK